MSKQQTVTIPLEYPVQTAGRTLDSVTLRRPKVEDQIAAAENAANEIAREAALFARLSGINPEDMRLLDWEDYQAVQQGYLRLFRKGDAPAAAAPGDPS